MRETHVLVSSGEPASGILLEQCKEDKCRYTAVLTGGWGIWKQEEVWDSSFHKDQQEPELRVSELTQAGREGMNHTKERGGVQTLQEAQETAGAFSLSSARVTISISPLLV